MNTKNQKWLTDQGFTLVELMVAMAISLVVMGAIFLTFKSQQDSYVVQAQITATQQNLRSAMYMLTRDIQMAGYYTNFDTNTYTTIDWDPTLGGNETTRPLIYGRNNDDGSGNDVKLGTDVIVIIKASNNSNDSRQLTGSDTIGTNTITLSPFDIDLDDSGSRFGLLIKDNLSRAEIFEITSKAGTTVTLTNNLLESYTAGDRIFRADVIIYKVDEDSDNPSLRRANLGNGGATFNVIAENIDNLQFRYLLSDGTWTNNTAGQEPNVRAVEISLLARTANTNRGYTDNNTYWMGGANVGPVGDAYRRKLLCSIVKTRNIGL